MTKALMGLFIGASESDRERYVWFPFNRLRIDDRRSLLVIIAKPAVYCGAGII